LFLFSSFPPFLIFLFGISVWQGVAMDSLKFHTGPPCPTLLCPASGLTPHCLMAVLGVACPQGGPPAAVFYSFGHPTPYDYAFRSVSPSRLSSLSLFRHRFVYLFTSGTSNLLTSGTSKLLTRHKHQTEFSLSRTFRVAQVQCGFDRNFPCQTLKIRKVSLVVMGS
jgi:hypothetical protein